MNLFSRAVSIAALSMSLSISSSVLAHNHDHFTMDRFGERYSYMDQEDLKLIDNFRMHLYTRSNLVTNIALHSYVSEITNRIAKPIGLGEYEIFIFEDETINAFAAPGGIIGVNTGLIMAAQTEGQLASVIAHEIAHLHQGHYNQLQEISGQSSLTSTAALIGSILVGMQDPEVGQMIMGASMGHAASTQLKFTRQYEREADAVGLSLLQKAGYSGHHMADMFNQLVKHQRLNQVESHESLRSHPVTIERIGDVKQRIQHASIEDQYENWIEYAQKIIKPNQVDISKKLMPSNTSETLLALEVDENTLVGAGVLNEPEYIYQRALRAQQNGDYEKANMLFSKLVFSKAISMMPHYWFEYAETLGKANQVPALHLARTKYFILTGNEDMAKRQLRIAEQYEDKLTHIQKSILQEIKSAFI